MLDDPPDRFPTDGYQPHWNPEAFCKEPFERYLARMRDGVLPDWPEDALRSWLYEHAGGLEPYAWLDYSAFRFRAVSWSTDAVPGRECFWDSGFCDDFSRKVWNPESAPDDWLLHHMIKSGTWPTPIIALENPAPGLEAPWGRRLSSPIHLLEGHRRLSFLNGLRQRGMAAGEHHAWVVRMSRNPMETAAYRQTKADHQAWLRAKEEQDKRHRRDRAESQARLGKAGLSYLRTLTDEELRSQIETFED